MPPLNIKSLSKDLDSKTICPIESTTSLTPSIPGTTLPSPSEAPGDEELGVEDCQFDPELYAAIPEPPDGGWGWVIVAASFLSNLVVDGITYTFGIFFPEFVTYYKSPKGTVAWVGSLLSGCYLSAGPIVSALTNKYGCRTVCICGSLVSCVAFLLSTIAPNVAVLMFTYGILGGVGFGLVYLPAIVSVNQYFSKKRALATGVAVCGSGLGAFIFAPVCQILLDFYGWKGALTILAGFCLNCAVFGALMRPLELNTNPQTKPLLQRIWEEKERLRQGSLCNSQFFLVQHADGTIEKRPKINLNTEPGVHSTLYLDQWGRSPMDTPVITLSPIEESRGSPLGSKEDDAGVIKEEDEGDNATTVNSTVLNSPDNPPEIPLDSNIIKNNIDNLPAPPPIITTPNGHVHNGGPAVSAIQEIAKRKGLIPSKSATKLSLSNITVNTASEMRRNSSSPRISASGFLYPSSRSKFTTSGEVWKRISQETVAGGQRPSISSKNKKKDIARPMYRKDIFYSGSVVNLPEYRQSQGDVRSYVASVLTLPADGADVPDGKSCWSSSCLPKSMTDILKSMLDVTLLTNPTFVLMSVSNVVGMMGFCIPFVYITDSAVLKGVDKERAAFLLSVIGIANMIGRLIFGWVSDFPFVNALLLNNSCILMSGILIAVMPLCSGYSGFVAVSATFGFIVAAYILLTSIILVQLFGLDNLTSSFGLLSLFRGAACMVGPPVAGSIFDLTGSYDWPFFVSGGLMVISSILSFLLPYVRNTAIKEEPMEDYGSPLEEIPEEEDIPEEDDEDVDNVETVV